MTYIEFVKALPPVLSGTISVNGKEKQGVFKPCWNHWSNSLCYQYFTENGRKGKGGFTLSRAYSLFINGQLTTTN